MQFTDKNTFYIQKIKNGTSNIKKTIDHSLNQVSKDFGKSNKARAVIECISSMIGLDKPLDFQHNIKLFWHSNNFISVLKGKPFEATPITMEIDPTLDCNYACHFCTYASWKKHTKRMVGMRFMNQEDMELILTRIAEGGVRGLIFTGGGEPFLNPYTTFGIEKACKLGIQTGIFTNGSLLTSGIIDRIIDVKPEFLRISANAVTLKVYTTFHGIRDEQFARTVWENIEMIASLIGKIKTNFGLGIVVNQINCNDIIPVIKRSLDIVTGGGRIDYIAVRPVVNYWGQKQISSVILNKVKQAYEEGTQLIKGSTLRLFFAMEFFETVVAASGQKPVVIDRRCIGHPWMASIAYSGDVYLCSEGKGMAGNRLGNLLTQTLEEIWVSALRAKVIYSSCNKPPVCKAHRLTTRLTKIMECGYLNDTEINIVENFLDKIRAAGEPGGVNFL